MDYMGIAETLTFNGWNELFVEKLPVYPELVVEFFLNLIVVDGEFLHLVSSVDGVNIILYPIHLWLILGVPFDGYDKYVKGSLPIEMDKSDICGVLSAGKLKSGVKMLSQCAVQTQALSLISINLLPKNSNKGKICARENYVVLVHYSEDRTRRTYLR